MNKFMLRKDTATNSGQLYITNGEQPDLAYRILLNVPVTVASAERSFSKLKLLTNYLRSTMSQERPNGLAMCCIEKNTLDSIDLDIAIDYFASKNARKSRFS